MAASKINVVLSCNNEDKSLQVTKDWTFNGFRKEIKKTFPHLPKDFSVADSDFNELTADGFKEIQESRVETWFFVRKNKDQEFKLDKPRYELLRYDVHPNALTQSGNYHFVSSYQAFCEFFDNSVQATNNNHEKGLERKIQLHLYLKERVAAIFDNGEGMTYEGLKAFATYFLSQADRGLEPAQVDQSPAFLDGLISKFGVGATQAGFYLGDRIKVVTKRDDCPYVTEITISKEKLHQRAHEGKPVFEDYRCIRNPGDMSTMELPEEEKCLKDLVSSEKSYSQFTCIIITGLKDSHIEYMKSDGGRHLTQNLAHVYHFYLWGEKGSSGNMRLPSPSRLGIDLGSNTFNKVNIEVLFDDGRNPRKSLGLKDIGNDAETRYQTHAKDWFPFSLTLKVPGLAMPQTVQGVLMYFPHEAGQETIPREIDDDVDAEPIFECFWQGRLAPLSYVHRLEFCSVPAQRTKKQKDILPDVCYRRLKGILFFNRHTPISNNKLKILLDERKDLSSALEDAAAERRLPQEFRAWIEKCHKDLDKEISFEELVPGQPRDNGDTYYKSIRVTTITGEQRFTQGDIVKLDTKPLMYGRVLYFSKGTRKHDCDKVVVIRQPEEVYLNQQEEKPISRIIEIPDANTLKKQFNIEKQMLPKTVRVYKDDQKSDVISSKITWLAGEKNAGGFWVKVFNGERPPKPMVALHGKKLSVRQIVEGPENQAPLQNDIPIEGERFGFKPFWLGKAGHYVLRYMAVLGDRDMCHTKIDIDVRANIAIFVRLDEPTEKETPLIGLGEASLRFKLHFRDKWNNPATHFKSGDTVRLEITSTHCTVKGTKDSYKPSKDGNLEVSGLRLEPKGGGKGQFGREHSIRVNAVDVGDVIFVVQLKAGTPHTVKLPSFDNLEFKNYEEFPEFSVQVQDSWGQHCGLTDRKHKLLAESEAFAPGLHLSGVDQGLSTFQPIKIQVPAGKVPCSMKVKISLVTVETVRRKQVVGEVLKELSHFSLKIMPSGLPHRIQICNGSEAVNGTANGVANGKNHARECLELSAPAGSILKGLRLIAFDESGKRLPDEELKEVQPKVTTSWSGEISTNNLPVLPDCPVAQLVRNTFVGNVTCACDDVTCNSQIRIHPIAGEAQKWSFVSDTTTVDIECDVKKQLAQRLRMQVLDKFGNPTDCPPEKIPVVSVDHSPAKQQTCTIEYSGELTYKAASKEFTFSNDAILTGNPGVVTMTVYDKDSLFTKDTQRISFKPGPAHHIEVWSQAFDSSQQGQEHTLKMFSGCRLPNPIQACVCDRSGNKTSLKTSLNLSWQPASVGQSVSKKTRESGEAMFTADVVHCTAKPEQEVKMKVMSSEHRQLQAALVMVSIEQSNRVVHVDVTVDTPNMCATGNYPTLQVKCQTEDGVRVDAVGHLTIDIQRPDGNVVNGSTAYRKPTQNREGTVTYLPHAGRFLEMAGAWRISCHFAEYRERLKSLLPNASHVTRSKPVSFTVQSGPAKEMTVNFPTDSPSTLSASSTADLRGRTILPRSGRSEVVELVILDAYGNQANVSAVVDISITWPSSTVPLNVLLPELEAAPVRVKVDRGKARLPRLTLKSRVGNYIGDYHLVFATEGMDNYNLKFAFSTDEHIQRIQNELGPLKKALTDCELSLHEAKRRCAMRRDEMRSKVEPIKVLFRAEPRSRDVQQHLQNVMGQIAEIKVAGNQVRAPRIQYGYPPARIRQYIKGIVAELAYVSDPHLACLLSWYLQHKMGVALTSTIQQQRKVYDAGSAAYCEATLLSFTKKNFDGTDGKSLPLEFPQPPPDFTSTIQFAINLLEFSRPHGYLRSSLFWSLLSKTIVIEDLRSGQVYREHLVRMRYPCPTILTRDGHVIASDGLMDPKRRCPRNMTDLKFAFGALPPTEQPKYRELQSTQSFLEDLSETLQEYEKEVEVVKGTDEQLKQKRTSFGPRVAAIEKELRKLRPHTADTSASEPPEKRKRK